MERFDIMASREGSDGKTYWTKLGAMFPHRNGEGFNIVLDAMPAPADGQWKLCAFTPKERDERNGDQRQSRGDGNGGYRDDRQQGRGRDNRGGYGQQRQQSRGGWNPPQDDLDDEIPF